MERSLDDIKKIALKHKWNLNPNPQIIEVLLAKENKNKIQFGEFYCPCKIQHIKQNICPCKDAQKEIDETGHCHCNLFVRD